MNCKNLLLFSLILLGSYFSAKAQSGVYCESNVDFELGTTANWNYYRGTNTCPGASPIWTFATCTPAPTLHTIMSGSSGTDYFGGFPVVGDGLYSLKLSKDSPNYNADAADYHVHVPSGVAYSLIYRYAIVFEDPGHPTTNQPRFEINISDSATGGAIPCNSFAFVSSGSLPGFFHSSFGGDVYYKPWTAGSIDLTGMGGKTIIVSFRVGGCTQSGHWGYAYVDMNCGLFKIMTVGCSGGTATVTAPPGYSAYNWTDSLTYTKAYGTTQTVTISVPTVTTTYAVILTPFTGYGCTDTLYAKLIPSNMVTHQSRDTSICQGMSVRIWGGATDILPLTYSWTPTTGLSCSTCDTTTAAPPVGVNSYKITTYNTGGCLQTDTIKVTVYPNAAAISGNKNVCLGSTTTLSNSVAGGSWTSSATIVSVNSATGVVTGTALGTAIVTYSFAGICPVVATVTVQPLPSSITGTSIVCVAFNTTLSDASAPGIWSSGSTAIATVGSTSGIVTGMSPGTAIITFTANSTTCYSIKVVTVIPLPAVITGLTTICQNDSTNLIDAGGGVWSSSNTTVATIGSSSGMVHGMNPGTATITYTIGSGCYVTTLMTIMLSPVPITGTPIMCAGATSALSDATPGGAWSSSDLTVATVGSGGLVTGVAPVTAIISYSLPTGCRAKVTVTVSALPTPILGSTSVCLGQTTGLSDLLIPGSWTTSNTNTSVGLSTGVVTGLAVGTSIITYTTPAACFTTTVVTVNANPAPITGTKTICTGLTSCLTDAVTGGTWTSSAPAIAGIVSTSCVLGVAPTGGTATISYTLGSGCYATTDVTVTPAPASITGTFKACVGQTTLLSDPTPGGTWSTTATTIATVGTSTGLVTGIGGGTATITYTGSTGCFTTQVVTINALPAPITGATGICLGYTSKLSDAIGGGAWSSTNTSVATITTSGLVSGLTVGTSVITYNLVLTGCYTTTVVNVSLAPGPILGTKSVCQGATTMLTDVIAGGTWTAGSTSVATIDYATGLVSGITVGTTTITYSLGGACVSNTTVTVLPLPAAITGTATVCVGATTPLTDATPGGTWSSSLATMASVSSSGLVTGMSAGTTAIISYTTSTFGCSATRNVTVNPLPAAFALTGVCVGSSVTLTDATSGGTWVSGTGSVATIGSSSGIVTGGAPGTSLISYKLTSTGCLISAPVTVYALPAAISGPATVCIGSTILVTDATPGGTWSTGSTTIGVSTSGIVSGISVGTGIVTYTASTGCMATRTITVNPLPAPITGPSAVCAGANITLSDASVPGVWNSANTTIMTINPTTGVVTGGSSIGSSTTITYLQSSTGCTVTKIVSVSPTPGPISGPSTLCVGTSVALSDAVTGGGWSAAPTAVGSIDPAGVYTGITTGTGIVTYSLGSSCSVIQVMTVNPLPGAITGGGALCLSQTMTLTDPVTGGVWTSSNSAVATVASSTSTTSIVTPHTVGTATITYSLGCFVTTTVSVSLSPSVISGPSTVCNGSTVSLSNTVAGGAWTSSAPSVASVAGFGNVTGNSPGSATITYSLGGACVATQNMTVNAVATISSATGSGLCTSRTTTLSSSIPGVWSSSNTAIATISSGGVVTGVTPGAVNIIITIPSGCATLFPMTISSTPAPITPAFGQVCIGSVTNLSDATPGGTWSTSTSSLVTVAPVSGDITGSSAGVATIVYSLGSGCSVTAPVTVYALPGVITATPANLCALGTTTLSNATPKGTWSTASGLISVGATSGIVTAGAVAGTALVSYTSPAGCVSTKILTINALPAPIGGTPSVCKGFSTTLTNSGVGTWSSAVPAIATIGATSGTAFGVAPGTSTISFTATSTGCSISTVFTVAPVPGSITVPPLVCVGVPGLTVSNPVSGGVWSSSDATVATVNPATGDLNAVASGTVLISYQTGSGCFIDTNMVVNPLAPIVGSSIVCIGLTTTFADSALGGVWTSSNTSIASVTPGTGLVTGVAKGLATILYTTPKGCVASLPVTVNAVPTAIAGSSQVCLGQPKTFTDAISGGVWSSSNPAVADVVVGSTSSTGIVTGYSFGTATISYTVGGCPATQVVSVNPLPAPIAGPTDACVGYTISLSDPTPGGTWTSASPIIASVGLTSGIVTGGLVGTATISYIVTSSGCYAKTNITVHPNPLPILSGPAQVCVASTISLSDPSPAGTWSSTDLAIASVSPGAGGTGDVLGLSAGPVDIHYTIGTGCYAKLTVTVNALPTALPPAMQLCHGSTVTLADAPAGGRWSSSNPAVATIGATSGVTYGVTPGTSIINYTLATSCMTSSLLTVNALPAPIVGPNSVCIGHITNLADATTGGNWSSSNALIAITDPSDNGDVKGVSAGMVTISYTDPSTTCSVIQAMTVTPLPTAIVGNTNVCLGSTFTFTNGTPGGVWSSVNTAIATVTPGPGTSGGMVTGLSLGNTDIAYTMSAGCMSTININVVPLPTKFMVTGGGSRCTDEPALAIGLNGSTKGTDYYLYKGGKIATGPIPGTGLALAFTPQSVAGTYICMATNTATGCTNMMDGSAPVIVNPIVEPTVKVNLSGSGDSTVCSGSSIVYTQTNTNPGSAPTFKWDINGTLVSTSSTPYTFIPANGDVVNVTMTSNATCARPAVVSSHVKMNVVTPVTPSATLSADPGDTVCQGLAVTFTPVPLYGGTAPVYSWYVNKSLVGSGSTFTYKPSKGDKVHADMTSNFGCLVKSTVSSNIVAVTVDSATVPSVKIDANPGTSVALGQTLILTAKVTNPGPGTPSYQWIVNGLPVAGETNKTYSSNKYSMAHQDSVSVEVTSTGLCAMTTHEWVYVSVHNVGVKQINAAGSDIIVLPNPNKGQFTVKGTLGTNNDEQVTLELTDLLGQVVYTNKVMAKGGNIDEQVVTSKRLANGMYMLSVRSEVTNVVFHVVIEQ